MDQLYREERLVEVYDALNASRSDFDFYRARLPTPPRRILDIGCGTGRFARALASAGYATTAIDPAPQMVAAAKSKSGANEVMWVVGFVADLDQKERFDAAVMTGHAFQCLLAEDQVLALFRDVAIRMSEGASFWFETRNPAAKAWERWTPSHGAPPVSLSGGGTVKVTRDVEAIEGEVITLSESYAFSNSDKPTFSQSKLRFMPLPTIQELAAMAGLRTVSVTGDWDGAAFDEGSPEIILKLQKAE
ncbi:class I SAM-dependent methyltransferase [Roseobacter weihaiensis]|uniref:class I SAM-dependent methyltransferase n=1 Tax=Roseobacter weihaiensis TaxID=2763262 RepID=UPI001D0B765C|nr:class I SAM-dependent methyltransferase [Roseobacter sp. H9]